MPNQCSLEEFGVGVKPAQMLGGHFLFEELQLRVELAEHLDHDIHLVTGFGDLDNLATFFNNQRVVFNAGPEADDGLVRDNPREIWIGETENHAFQIDVEGQRTVKPIQSFNLKLRF